MRITIVLDKEQSTYTNLDTVSGKVCLHVARAVAVSSVTAKLEGESRVRLRLTNNVGESTKTRVEIHKVLYKVNTVFPEKTSVVDDLDRVKYTLDVGYYEFGFSFKIPFNNTCYYAERIQASPTSGFHSISSEISKLRFNHVKKALPPSLSGLPGESEINYYVKATVNKPQFFNLGSPRAVTPFVFLPIEPPRPSDTGREAFARREPKFSPHSRPSISPRKSIFDGALSSERKSSETDLASPEPPKISLDARLPSSSILTCNEPLPLKILVKQINERTEPIYLQSIQIELIGYTRLRAEDCHKTNSDSWVIISMSDMGVPLGRASEAAGSDVWVDNKFWKDRSLPNTVAPSFETCNISRHYELETRVGIGYGSRKSTKGQLVILPLRLPVRVFSGVAPSPSLLAAMANSWNNAPVLPPRRERLNVNSNGISTNVSTSPSSPAAVQSSTEGPSASSASATYEEAPPAYEDAVAEDLPPIYGPRRNYVTPTPTGESSFFPRDSKRHSLE